MTGHSGFDDLIDALRGAFVGRDGDPVEVKTQQLDDAQLRGLLDGAPDDSLALVVPGDAVLDELLPGLTVSAAVGVVSGGQGVLMFATDPVSDRHRALVEGAGMVAGPVAGLVRQLQTEASVLDLMHSVGRDLTAQLDLDVMVQDATDAATKATGAEFGAFFYNLVDEMGESYTRYTISGVPREAFSRFPMPRNSAVFAPTFDGVGTVRSADITQDARFGRNAPYYGMPEGHLPVRSYLAVLVISPTTEKVLGGFFFGHPQPDRFTARHAFLAEGIARYAAIALDNARLYERERTLVTELSRSMLTVVSDVAGADVVTRYLPATMGSKIGGDWFDVIPLSSGATAFVIGDVVGHGVTAATIPADDLWDGTHPNAQGEVKIAAAFADSLAVNLSVGAPYPGPYPAVPLGPQVAPQLTATPATGRPTCRGRSPRAPPATTCTPRTSPPATAGETSSIRR